MDGRKELSLVFPLIQIENNRTYLYLNPSIEVEYFSPLEFNLSLSGVENEVKVKLNIWSNSSQNLTLILKIFGEEKLELKRNISVNKGFNVFELSSELKEGNYLAIAYLVGKEVYGPRKSYAQIRKSLAYFALPAKQKDGLPKYFGIKVYPPSGWWEAEEYWFNLLGKMSKE